LFALPLSERRERLEHVLRGLAGEIQLSTDPRRRAAEVLEQVRNFEFEGVVAKRLGSIYQSSEAPGTWQKQKTQRSADFLVGGYILGHAGVDQASSR
jgi:ATP-dependent DNA ligase